jgi:hypothetical protein
MPYIHYSGLGANETEIHSIEDFLNIMNHPDNYSHYYKMSSFGVDMEYKKYSLPADYIKFTLEEWIDYSGAKYYDSDW